MAASDAQDFQQRIFISYSRADSSFVDRLEADLRARNIYTWVDRRKLEGGSIWIEELEKAINRCNVMLVVLSPDMLGSKWIRMEYLHALNSNKIVIPLLHRKIDKVPFVFNSIQWISAFERNYDHGLHDLLNALGSEQSVISPSVKSASSPIPRIEINDADLAAELVAPRPAPPPPEQSLNELFRMGVNAKARGDIDRAALYWRQVIEREPGFQNGEVRKMLQQVEQALVPIRVERLRERANDANKRNAWGEEIGTWEALLKLNPSDSDARKALATAEQNHQYAWMYENALAFIQANNKTAAIEQLNMLWQRAPQYGDPDQLAKMLRIKPPPNRQQAVTIVKRRQQRDEILSFQVFFMWRVLWWLMTNPAKVVEHFRVYSDSARIRYYQTIVCLLSTLLFAVPTIPLIAICLGIVPLSRAGIAMGIAPIEWLMTILVGWSLVMIVSIFIRSETGLMTLFGAAGVLVGIVIITLAFGIANGITSGFVFGIPIGFAIGLATLFNSGEDDNFVYISGITAVGGAGIIAGVIGIVVAISTSVDAGDILAVVVAVIVGYIFCVGGVLFSILHEYFIRGVEDSLVNSRHVDLSNSFLSVTIILLMVAYVILVWLYWLGGWKGFFPA